MTKTRSHSSPFGQRLAAIMVNELRTRSELSLSHTQSKAVADAVACRVAKEFGGTEIYVALGCGEERQARDQSIRTDFCTPGPDGAAALSPARAAQIAAAHRLSVRRVRAILSRVGERASS